MTTVTTRGPATRQRLIRRLAVPVLLLVPGGLAAACGGGEGPAGEVASVQDGESQGQGNGNSDGGGAGHAEDPVAQGEQFAGCLRGNGLEVPDPDPETGLIDFQGVVAGDGRDALTEAFDACRELAPDAYTEQQDPTGEQLTGMREFAACMRAEGVDMADPGPEGFDPGAIDMNDPAVQGAMDACQDELDWTGRPGT